MELTPEQIKSNWDEFINYIEKYIQSPRKEKLIEFYKRHEERIALIPVSSKKGHHSCFPGGYIYHVNKVIEYALNIHEIWTNSNDFETYTLEELIFSAINHDLGKIGTEEEVSYLPSEDAWRKKNLGEMYKHSDKFPYMSVPDRSLFLLQENQIPMSMNEFIAIKVHDGLYDESNKQYLISYTPEKRPRTALVYILHSADMMAARYEFEQEWLKNHNQSSLETSKKDNTMKSYNTNGNSNKTKALKTVKSEGLKNMLDNL